MSAFFNIFSENRLLSCAFLILLLLSIICQIVIGVIYQKAIKETDKMSATSNKLLKQCKKKFVSCYQLNAGVPNIPVFVDKLLSGISVMGITLSGFQHLSGQFMLLSVVAAGIAACKEIIQGETVGMVLPYYIAAFLGLYAYFSISGMVDVQGKRDRLKTNLIDYLENHMANKLKQSALDWEELTGEKLMYGKEEPNSKGKSLREEIGLSASRGEEAQAGEKEPALAGKDTEEGWEKKALLTHQEEQELEELLREFLA